MPATNVPLSIPPGIFRNGTPYQARGRWHDGNLVRFYSGTIEPIGGWRTAQSDAGADIATLSGIPRGCIAWRSGTNVYIALATTNKLYVLASGTLFDITPAGFTVGIPDTTTASGSYGAGVYGGGSYGVGSVTSALLDADTWQLDTFGDYLVGVCTSDKKLYIWLGNTANPAVVVDISAATGAPTTSAGVVVTPERFLFALGTGGNGRRVSWSSQQTYNVWGPLITNTAGGFDLTTDGRIMCGQRTKNETLIWTDVDVHAARYIGGTLLYRFDQVGDKCGIISRRAKAVVATTAFWMGKNNFFVYDGFTKALESEVRDYVFGDFNRTQAAKVWALSIAEFGEIWWFYCSGSSTEIDRYVVYNYQENHWNIGQLTRTAGADAGANQYPILMDSLGKVYEHEILQSRPAVTSLQPGIDILTESNELIVTESGNIVLATEQTAPFLESGPMQIEEGDFLTAIESLIPDEKTLGDVRAFVYSSLYPTSAETTNGPYDLSNPTDVRLTARQVRLRLEEVRATDWRVGTIRFGIRQDTRR